MSAATLPVAALSTATREAFVAALGGVFEHSPWIAERAYEKRPFESVDALHAAMLGVLDAAPTEAKLALICAHPELAGREAAAGTLTAESTGEQSSAGLDRCTPAELAQLRERNRAYRDKFGFPFVMAVKGRSRREILDALAARLSNERDREFAQCLSEIGRIARLRLDALFGEG